VWASAENEINKQKLESTMRSLAQTKQHKEKKVSAAAKDWELGVPFKDASSKSRATKLVLDALVASTKEAMLHRQPWSCPRLFQGSLFSAN
jgi:hypothetical protein